MDPRTGKLLWLFVGCLLSGLAGGTLYAPAVVVRLPGQSIWEHLWRITSNNLAAYLLIFLSFAMGLAAICCVLFHRRSLSESSPEKNTN